MPPTANVHIDSLLTGVASGYKNEDYIADQVLPIVPVAKETGKIANYGTEHYRLDFNARAMGADTPRGDWSASTPLSFAADDWEFEIPVDDRQRSLYDDPFDAERDATLTVVEKIMLKREDVVASLLTTAGNFGGTTTGSAWGTPATGVPVTNIRAAMRAIVARTGVSRRRLVGICSDGIWDKLIQNNEVKNLYLNTVPGAAGPGELEIKPEQLARAIGLQAIYVGPGVKLTSKEGAADAFTDIWGTSTFAVIAKSPRPSLMAPGYGILISPTVPGFKGATIAVDKYREEKKRSDIVRAAALFDTVAVTKNLGQLITGIS